MGGRCLGQFARTGALPRSGHLRGQQFHRQLQRCGPNLGPSTPQRAAQIDRGAHPRRLRRAKRRAQGGEYRMGAVLGLRRPLEPKKDGHPMGVGPGSRRGLRPLHVFAEKRRLAVLDDERRPCGRPRPRSNRLNPQQLVSRRIGSRCRWVGRIPLQRARVRPDVPHFYGGRAIHHVGGPFNHR